MKIHICYLLVLIGALSACNKENPAPPLTLDPFYKVVINNELNELQGRYAVWISDEEGAVRAFRWVPGADTAHVEVPDSKENEIFDCTIARVFPFEMPGSGVRDTTITLTTYTNLANGETVNLRNLAYIQTSDLSFTLKGVNTLDSIIVADGLPISRPQPGNNYFGQYRIEHTGRVWFRVLVNGEMFWRYLYFDNVSGDVNLNEVDVNLMTMNLAHPAKIDLPFTTTWKYKVDGVVDTATLQFVPLGDIRRVPGGAEQVISALNVFEPVANEDFMPEPKPYSSFRLRMNGTSDAADGYNFFTDDFYQNLPAQLPAPNFDLEPTFLSDNRNVAVRCIGDFDLLSFTRNYAGAPINITWEVVTKPKNGTIIVNRLPDVPKELGDSYRPLAQFQFGDLVHTRAENYQRLNGYEAVIQKRLQNSDPLWQAKGGYTGREEVY